MMMVPGFASPYKIGGPRHSKRRLKNNYRLFLYVIVPFLIFGGILYIVFFSVSTRIKTVEVQASDEDLGVLVRDFVSARIQDNKRTFFREDNYFFVDSQSLVELISDGFSEIRDARIQKKISRLIIILEEREAEFTFCEMKINLEGNAYPFRCYLLDKTGVAFKESPVIEGGGSLMIESPLTGEETLGREVVSAETLQKIKEIREYLSDSLQVRISSVNIYAGYLDIKTSAGWHILFGVSKNINSQMVILKRLIDQEIKDKTAALQYIDLRTDGRIYYK